MKLEDFVYNIVQKVFWELEHTHHFVIPEHIRKNVIEKLRAETDTLIKSEKPRR